MIILFIPKIGRRRFLLKLNQEIVRELFDYDADVGKLSWKKLTPLREKKGGVVGYKHCMGYQAVSILGEEYLVHRIIWLWNYGYMPEHVIDHIDKDKQNNKLNNLREVTTQCNIRNSKLCKKNTSGVKGVSWYGRDNVWVSYIKVSRGVKSLGRYKDFVDAVAARLAGEQALDWDGCDSTSPAYLYMKNYVK